jgi:hypothetical protein
MRHDPVVFWMPQWSRRAIRALATAACILMSCAAPSLSGNFSEVPNFGSNPGHLKMFKYLPDRISDQAPLVVVMAQRLGEIRRPGQFCPALPRAADWPRACVPPERAEPSVTMLQLR